MRPNIVLFLTDDHAPWSLPAYGNRDLSTPNFDNLAGRATLFENAFAPSPVCSPARACLMTGLTPSQTGVHDWLDERIPEVGERDWLANIPTLPGLLRSQGYHTILSGKWHLGQSHKVPHGFNRAFGLPYRQGSHFETYTYHQDGTPVTIHGNKTSIITDRAIAMLDERSTGPFFLNVGYIATHSPYETSAHDPEFVAATGTAPLTGIPSYMPHPWVKNEGCNASGSVTKEEIQDLARGYYAGVLEIDHALGRIVNYLEANRLLDNTIIIYVSDHGCCLGHHGFFGKGNSTRPLNMYENSLRIPLMIAGPQVSKSSRAALPVDHYDLFLGICEWSGVIAPAETSYPGRSLSPLTKGENPGDWRLDRYGEYGDMRMLRSEKYKYIRRYPNGPDELFDLRDDPTETRAISDTAKSAGLCSKLESWYSRFEDPLLRGTRVKCLPKHNPSSEAWRDGKREARGLQIYPDNVPATNQALPPSP